MVSFNWRFNLDTWREIGKVGNPDNAELQKEVKDARGSQLRSYVYGVLERTDEDQEKMLLLLTLEQQHLASLFIDKLNTDYEKFLSSSK